MKEKKKGMFHVVPDCEEAAHRSWLQLRALPLSTRQVLGLKMHLLVCRDCSTYQKNLAWVSETLNDIAEAPPLDGGYKLRPVFKDELRKAIDLEKP